jgi:hypothetical protein
MENFLPLMMLSGLGRQERAAVLERMLPAMLPVSGGQRLTFTALMAEQQVKRQLQVEEQLVGEAVKAAKFTRAEELAPFPTLQQKFANLSAAAKAKIFPPPTPRPEPDPAGASRKS